MKLSPADLDARYAHILETCEPYLVTWPGNHDALDLAPFGVKLAEERLYSPTHLRSREVIDGLHFLDAFSFGDQEMLMPRWVLYDCGEFPGIVFGFGRKAKDCPDGVRGAYRAADPEHDDQFLPLSMWVAIRCAEDGAWFGHNLSSANLVAGDDRLPGLATITKAFGVRLTKSTKQYGATQWDSSSLNIHLSMGTMHLLSAYTPAHTHLHTFSYRIDVTPECLSEPLLPGWARPSEGGDRHLDAEDNDGILTLHEEIEAGLKWTLLRVERREGSPQRLWMNKA